MDYRRTVAEARRRRDELLERATSEAREAIARAVAERDAEIRKLRAEGLTYAAIAPLVGCSEKTAYEAARPDKRREYNARRAEGWRRRHMRAVA